MEGLGVGLCTFVFDFNCARDPAPTPPALTSCQRMLVMDGGESELMRLWALVVDLSDQLAQNRSLAASLQAQAGHIKSQAIHSGTGFPLRRFNTHLDAETYRAELERMTSALAAENAVIASDNKLLAQMVRENESTLETVMAEFRGAALSAQEHELGLARHYETELLNRETQFLTTQLAQSSAVDAALGRVAQRLRAALRLAQGEQPLPEDEVGDSEDSQPVIPVPEDARDTYTGELPSDWALDRECELIRLERENAELRRMLGAAPPEEDDGGLHSFRGSSLPRFGRRPTGPQSGLGVYSAFSGGGRGLAIGRMAPPEWNEGDVWRNVQERDARAGLLS